MDLEKLDKYDYCFLKMLVTTQYLNKLEQGYDKELLLPLIILLDKLELAHTEVEYS